MIKQRKESFTLSAQTVDALSQLCAQALAEAEVERKDALRVRLSLEEILEVWLGDMAGARVEYKAGHRLGRQHIEIAVEGPHIPDRDSDQAFFLSSRLLAQSGLVPVYSYKDGYNCLSLEPPKKRRLSAMAQLGIAVALAIVLGLVCGQLPEGVRAAALAVTEPLFDLFAGALRAVASPLILLSVCWGIVGMGDLSALGKVGRRVITRMVRGSFLVGALTVLATLWLFPVTTAAENSVGGFSAVYQMLLDIVPSDIVSPFLTGNALQIIFLGVCLGVALLALGTRVSGVSDLVGQCNELVQYFMAGIGKLLPLFIFLSLFNLTASGVGTDAGGILKIVLILLAACAVLLGGYLLQAALRFKISPLLLLKKTAPAFLIAVTTASSSAAMTASMDTCEKDLGIPRNVTGFAVPLGQIVYMPAAVICFLTVSLCMAEAYSVAITPVWLITAVISTAMMAIASPPVPGGSMGMYTVLFAQLGIPGPAIALAVTVDSLLDFVVTAVNVFCLQVDLVLAMGRMGELDEKALRAQKTKTEK